MKLLVVGSGGREHALAWKLKQSPQTTRLFCAPGNAGTEEIAENVPIAANDIPALVAFAKDSAIDFTVIGPDDPLANGIVDAFVEQGLRVFGPTKSAARLEASKIFAKQLMQARGIPTARAETFSDVAAATRYCDEVDLPVVLKADGLALGKGVIVAETREAAREAIRALMDEQRFGAAGARVVIEEFLGGTECSLHALVGGGDFLMLATARDHKRAFDGDRGPNTGGMGAVSPAEIWNTNLEREFEAAIMRPLLAGLREEEVLFSGLLFPGLMMTPDGARVLEFNCRFGDPETQAIVPRLRSDLLELLIATPEGRLRDCAVELDPRVSVTVVIASGGYPDHHTTGHVISGLMNARQRPYVQVFHAGTKRSGDDIVTSGGRVLAVTALGIDVAEARRRAYEAVDLIHFEGCRCRRDIAA